MGLGVLQLLVLWGLFSFFLPNILNVVLASHVSPEQLFGRFFLFYLMLDLVVRFFFQSMPALNYPHYALLPINKRKLFSSLLLSSALNVFNLAGLLLVLPFWLWYIVPELGAGSSAVWILTVIGAILTNHFLCIWIKGRIYSDRAFLPALIVAVVILMVLVSLEVLSLTAVSSFLFGQNLNDGYILPLFAVLPVLFYFLSRNDMLNSIYEIKGSIHPVKAIRTSLFSQTRGSIFLTLFEQELLLILSNKRTRKVLIGTAFFVLASFYMFNMQVNQEFMVKEFPALVLFFLYMPLGFWFISYGQFLTAWESSYFDGLVSLPISTEDYIKAKWLILAVPVTLFSLLALPLAAFKWSYLLELIAIWLLFCGPMSLIAIAAGIYNKKRLNINKASLMESEGSLGIQIIFLLLPFLLLFASIIPFGLLGSQLAGLLFWMTLGISIIITHSYWIRKLSAMLNRYKYKKLDGYRKTE